MKALAVLILEILTRKLKSNLAFFLTMSISKAFAVQTPAFEKILLKSRRRLMHGLEAIALALHEISTRKLNSNLAFILTLSISKPFLVQTPGFEKMLLKSRQIITHDMKVAGVLIRE